MGQHEKPANQKRSTDCRRQANSRPITDRSIEDRLRDWNSDTPMPWPKKKDLPEPSVGCPLSGLGDREF